MTGTPLTPASRLEEMKSAPYTGPTYAISNPYLPATVSEGALWMAIAGIIALPFRPMGVVVGFALLVNWVYGRRRWQAYPTDVAAAVTVAAVVLEWAFEAWGVYFRVAMGLLLLLAVAANAFMPIPQLPKPTGPYSVAVHDVFLQRNGLEFRTRMLFPVQLSKHAKPAE